MHLMFCPFCLYFSLSDVNINSTDDSHVVAHTSAALIFYLGEGCIYILVPVTA